MSQSALLALAALLIGAVAADAQGFPDPHRSHRRLASKAPSAERRTPQHYDAFRARAFERSDFLVAP